MINNSVAEYKEVKRVCETCQNQDTPGFIAKTDDEFAEYLDANFWEESLDLKNMEELRKFYKRLMKIENIFEETGCILCPDCEGKPEWTEKI